MTLPCASVCEKPSYTTLTKSYVPTECGDESVPLTDCRSTQGICQCARSIASVKALFTSSWSISSWSASGCQVAGILGALHYNSGISHNPIQCDADGSSYVAP